MELLTGTLRLKITQLVEIDTVRQSAILKDGVSAFSTDENQVKARQELDEHGRSLTNALGELNDDELTAVIALATYGDPRVSFDGNTEFADAMEDAREFVGTSERDRVIGNLSSKALSEYLPTGLKRARFD